MFADSSVIGYALKKTTDNTPVVVVNDDITRNAHNEKELIKAVKNSLGKFKRVPIKGQSIYFDKKTKSEYTYSRYTQKLRKKNPQVYKDKMRVAGHTQDIVYATTEYVNEGLKHPRNDDIVDFARGNVLIDVSGRQYTAKAVIGFTESGTCRLYDIVRMTPTQFEYKKETAPLANNSYLEPSRNGVTSFKQSIPQNTQIASKNLQPSLSNQSGNPLSINGVPIPH